MTRNPLCLILLLAVAGCGQQAPAPEPSGATPTAGPAAPPPTSSPTPMPAVEYVALGEEPFWRIETHADRMVYSTPEQQDGVDLAVTPTVVEGWAHFEAMVEGKRLVLEVRKGQCFDGMSGFEFSHQARLIRSDGTWPGCARLASEPQPRE